MSTDALDEIQIEGDEAQESPDLSHPAEEREILTKAGDPEICALHDKYKKGKLVLQPDFQRQFVWDRKKASRLIESVLLSVPLPIVYLSEQPDGKEYVIDGQQRLTSLFSFIDGKFPSGEEFRLIGLNPFFDRKPAAKRPWTSKLWIYDLRTNKHFTLKENTLKRMLIASCRLP